MEYIQKEFKGMIKDKYRFSFLVSVILVVFILLISITTYWYSVLWLIIPVSLLFIYKYLHFRKEINAMDRFLQTMTLGNKYKMIDNTVFAETYIYSYFINRYYSYKYDDILSASHNGNVFEKARPPYRGNHSVSIKVINEQGTITLKTYDGMRADKVLCYLKTMNPKIELFGLESKYLPATLEDLENWKINERF